MNRYKISPGGKLSGHRGESIAETLAALLVTAMGLLILAQMIGAGAKVTQESRLLYDAYYSSDTALSSTALASSEAGGPSAVLVLKNSLDSSETWQFHDGSETIRITYRKNNNATNVPEKDRPVSYALASSG